MRVIYFNARGSRHILGGDFRLFQSGSHLSFLRHITPKYLDLGIISVIFNPGGFSRKASNARGKVLKMSGINSLELL